MPQINVTDAEFDLVLKLRQQSREKIPFNRGVEACAQRLEGYAREACGGSGKGGEIYTSLAQRMRELMVATNV